MKDSDGVNLLRKDRNSRGGGVAIAFDSKNASFEKMKLSAMSACDFEIVVAKGKLNGKHKGHIVVSCYLPPAYNKTKTSEFFEKLIDVISEAKAKNPDCWLTVGGDWNGKSLQGLLEAYPELVPLDSGPTRKNATLDIIITNYKDLSLIHI